MVDWEQGMSLELRFRMGVVHLCLVLVREGRPGGVKLRVLEMYGPLVAYLRDVVEIEENICDNCETKQDSRCDHENDGVDIGLTRRFGRRDVKWLHDEILL